MPVPNPKNPEWEESPSILEQAPRVHFLGMGTPFQLCARTDHPEVPLVLGRLTGCWSFTGW